MEQVSKDKANLEQKGNKLFNRYEDHCKKLHRLGKEDEAVQFEEDYLKFLEQNIDFKSKSFFAGKEDVQQQEDEKLTNKEKIRKILSVADYSYGNDVYAKYQDEKENERFKSNLKVAKLCLKFCEKAHKPNLDAEEKLNARISVSVLGKEENILGNERGVFRKATKIEDKFDSLQNDKVFQEKFEAFFKNNIAESIPNLKNVKEGEISIKSALDIDNYDFMLKGFAGGKKDETGRSFRQLKKDKDLCKAKRKYMKQQKKLFKQNMQKCQVFVNKYQKLQKNIESAKGR